MPTYSYACTECDHRFDAVQAFTDDALTSCPQCTGKLRKLFNSVGVVFKGSGFYRNDSRESSKSSSGAPSSAKPASTGSESAGTSGSEKSSATSESSSGSSSPNSGAPNPGTSSSSAPKSTASATASS